jgi:hypothetical protein
MQPRFEQQTIEYPVTQFQPDVQLQDISFYEYRSEQVPRVEQFVVEVPQQRTRTREVTTMESVPYVVRQPYTVMVAYQQQVQVPVQRVRYVRQTVQVPQRACCGGVGF